MCTTFTSESFQSNGVPFILISFFFYRFRFFHFFRYRVLIEVASEWYQILTKTHLHCPSVYLFVIRSFIRDMCSHCPTYFTHTFQITSLFGSVRSFAKLNYSKMRLQGELISVQLKLSLSPFTPDKHSTISRI